MYPETTFTREEVVKVKFVMEHFKNFRTSEYFKNIRVLTSLRAVVCTQAKYLQFDHFKKLHQILHSFSAKTCRHQRNDAEEDPHISVLWTRGLEPSSSLHHHHLLLSSTLVDRKTSVEN